MRAFRIDVEGVAEVDLADDFLEASDRDWDYFQLDAFHDVWVDDMGLYAADLELARVGPNGTVPLPAYVFGSDRGRTVGATLSIDEMMTQVSDRRRSTMSFSVS